MTAEIEDTFRFDGRDWSLIGIRCKGLFDPSWVDISAVPFSTSCNRGFYCTYDIDDGLFLSTLMVCGEDGMAYPNIAGIAPRLDNAFQAAEYREIRLLVPLSGGLLLGREFIADLYVHLGLQMPHAYGQVREFRFRKGRLTFQHDHSHLFAQVRELLAERYKGVMESAEPASPEEATLWTQHRFHLNYRQWGVFRDFNAVLAGRIAAYGLSAEEKRQLRRDAEQARRIKAEHEQKVLRITAEKEAAARELFSRIEREGGMCPNCDQRGHGHDAFRLSIGPASCVICRKCGWVQQSAE